MKKVILLALTAASIGLGSCTVHDVKAPDLVKVKFSADIREYTGWD